MVAVVDMVQKVVKVGILLTRIKTRIMGAEAEEVSQEAEEAEEEQEVRGQSIIPAKADTDMVQAVAEAVLKHLYLITEGAVAEEAEGTDLPSKLMTAAGLHPLYPMNMWNVVVMGTRVVP